MTVCPKLRVELGIFWRPGRKCTHPLHGGRKGRPEKGANLQICKEAMKKWRVLIPVGGGNGATHDSIYTSKSQQLLSCFHSWQLIQTKC